MFKRRSFLKIFSLLTILPFVNKTSKKNKKIKIVNGWILESKDIK